MLGDQGSGLELGISEQGQRGGAGDGPPPRVVPGQLREPERIGNDERGIPPAVHDAERHRGEGTVGQRRHELTKTGAHRDDVSRGAGSAIGEAERPGSEQFRPVWGADRAAVARLVVEPVQYIAVSAGSELQLYGPSLAIRQGSRG